MLSLQIAIGRENFNSTDFERPLNNRGLKDAPIMGRELGKLELKIDQIISSPANRAISTARIIASEINYPLSQIKEDVSIYEASTRTIFRLLESINNLNDTIAIFGHNPTFSTLIENFTNESIGNLPTCGIAIIDFEISDWKEIAFGTGTMRSYLYPKLFK